MFQKVLNINDELRCDVAVIGGGTAGVFAAVCAAKSGAKTMLIEKTSLLGGTAINAAVNFPGLFFAWGRQIIGGPCWEAVKRTEALGGADIPEMIAEPEKHWSQQIRVNPFLYENVLETMCAEAGVTVRLHTCVAFADETGKDIVLGLCGKNALAALHADVVIDATGDANIAAMLGCALMRSAELQPGTLVNRIGGYDIHKVDQNASEALYHAALEHGEVTTADFLNGSPYNALLSGTVNFHIAVPDASDSVSKTAVEQSARAELMRIVSFLRKIPGAEKLFVEYFAPECGIRETVRIVGETIMTVEKYLSGHVYDDAVAYCFYPVDLHVGDGIRQVFLKKGVIPTIPYGALVPRASRRLLVAGRCVSSDTETNSACRVQAACMAMGQAAGTAAAIAAQSGCFVKDVGIVSLKEKLKTLGAIIPDFKGVV